MAQNSTYVGVARYGKQELGILGDAVDMARLSGPPVDLPVLRTPLKAAALIRTTMWRRVVQGKSLRRAPSERSGAVPQ